MQPKSTNHSKFVHLHLHSSYSLLEGAIPPDKLVELCKRYKMSAVAVTDTGNMFAALEISELLSSSGIQPIIGCQLSLEYDSEKSKPETAPIVLLAKDNTGYKNLMKLSTLNFLEDVHKEAHINFSHLQKYSSGLICLTGGVDGPIGKKILLGDLNGADVLTDYLLRVFDNCLYFEIQRHPTSSNFGTREEIICEPVFLEIAYKKEIPIVATNNVYFPGSEMYEAHDALLCISSGSFVDQQAPRRRLTNEHYFKSSEQMCELFSDLPEAIGNTMEIAQRCSVKAELCSPILPKYAKNEVEELRKQSISGLKKRLKVISLATTEEKYFERLNFELNIIEDMGFPGYFLIVADFIKWAKGESIPVGPGRGSGAGSLVAYALTITDLDPIRYSLLFERFLNPERISMPDFDIDFCMDRREEVISYVQDKYGKDRVAQIITFGALLSKAAIRDIGRVLQVPYSQVDRLSKMIPVDGVKPVSIAKALKDEPKLLEEKKSSEAVARLLDYAQSVEGLLRNAATHAAGVVIADRSLDLLVPLYKDPRSEMPATQFNMKWVEQAGLVKFDFLGLKTLTIVKNAVDLLKERGLDIDINNIPLDNYATFQLYASAQTVAVFQVESPGMRDALVQLKPTCIEDIIALVALYRPGPMENIPKFCAVKNGNQPREKIHDLIDELLNETQGIIVYQEQVMEIARKMAGYSLGEADLLRRAMGKKIKVAMDAEKPKFLEGSKNKGVEKKTAIKVWDLLEKFANYGFNKSHAAAYAVLSYQTAWLKANYPVEFMAAVMNCDIHLTEKLSIYKQEVNNLSLVLNPPCVNKSQSTFSVYKDEIFYALGAIKNVGPAAMDRIVSARESGGNFKDVFDFARRIDLRKVGKRPLEMLIRAGALDSLNKNRRRLLESIEILFSYSSAVFSEVSSAQTNLFGAVTESILPPKLVGVADWLFTKRLSEEYQAVGFYLSGHPIDEYLSYLQVQNVAIFSGLTREELKANSTISVVGVVVGKQERQSNRGNRFAFLQVSDPGGIFEATVFSDVLEKNRVLFEAGKILNLVCEIRVEAEQIKIQIRGVYPIEKLLEKSEIFGYRIFINSVEAVKSIASRLAESCSKDETLATPINIVVVGQELKGDIEINVADTYALTPDIVGAIKHISGVVHIEPLNQSHSY